MQNSRIYIKDWLALHPYTRQQPSDSDYLALANRLLGTFRQEKIAETVRKKMCIYAAAYLEDILSGLGLWRSFTSEHRKLYGTTLPFYGLSADYLADEPNEEDIRFILWNTLQMSPSPHPYINPWDTHIEEIAKRFCALLDEAYETAPENEMLTEYFHEPGNEDEAQQKLKWLFRHTYLTEPSAQIYIEMEDVNDLMLLPCGPHALCLHEWIDLLTDGQPGRWREIDGLYPIDREGSEEEKQKNRDTWQRFTQGTGGAPIVYLSGYESLRHFLTHTMGWPDDEDHSLPQLKGHRNFVLMANPEKGMLIAVDLCESIADPLNPLYQPKIAAREAFQLLTVPGLCPPDLLQYLLTHHYLPDLQFPDLGEKALAQKHADFIARHSLLYHYRGD